MMHLDYQALCDVFNAWATQYERGGSGQWVAFDGKSLRNTVSDHAGAEQNFVSIVSAFSHSRGQVLGINV